MQTEFNKIHGRIGVIAAVGLTIVVTIVLALAALALYLYSERAVPPVSEAPGPEGASSATLLQPESVRRDGDGSSVRDERPPLRVEPASGGRDGSGNADEAGASESAASDASPHGRDPEALPEAEISLEREQQRLREDLEVRLGPGQIDKVVEERLLQRLVTTLNSLDGEAVPLRFRPLDHVPGLPRLAEEGEHSKLPDEPDPRYGPYRAMFDRLDAVELAELFDHYEPALERAWQELGEHAGKRFRIRLIEVLDHIAEFELPQQRPAVHQPKVLYEYIDPSLEQLSWGRKVLIRIGPEHAPEVQRKLGELADELARRDRKQRD